MKRLYFRGDAAFANPEMYEFLKTERIGYAIRLPASILQRRIGSLLKRPVGRPPLELRRYYSSFSYQAQSWNEPFGRAAPARRLHRDEPGAPGRALRRILQPARDGGAMDQGSQGRDQNGRDSRAEHSAPMPCVSSSMCWLDLGNFMRTSVMPKTAEPWSLTSLREKLIKIGAKVISHGRYGTFQMAETAVSRQMFADILSLIARCGYRPRQHGARGASGAASDEGRGMPRYR